MGVRQQNRIAIFYIAGSEQCSDPLLYGSMELKPKDTSGRTSWTSLGVTSPKASLRRSKPIGNPPPPPEKNGEPGFHNLYTCPPTWRACPSSRLFPSRKSASIPSHLRLKSRFCFPTFPLVPRCSRSSPGPLRFPQFAPVRIPFPLARTLFLSTFATF